MFVARSAKRAGAGLFARDMLLDILDGERLVGRLSCDRKSLSSTLALNGQAFTVAFARGAQDEVRRANAALQRGSREAGRCAGPHGLDGLAVRAGPMVRCGRRRQGDHDQRLQRS